MPPVDSGRGAKVLGITAEVARAHGATLAQVAIAWLMTKPGVTSVLLGATSADQLTSNMAAATLELTTGELRALDECSRQREQYPEWLPEYAEASEHGQRLSVY